MAQAYLLRCVLDTDEDVIRDLLVQDQSSLMSLHQAIISVFDLHPGEMSSFFRSNDNWEQGEEISMMDLDPKTGKNPLESTSIMSCFEDIGGKMLFVYDFLNLWTFYVEAVDIMDQDPEKTYPRLVGKTGERPDEAPVKNMESENPFGDEGEIEEDFDEENNEDWY